MANNLNSMPISVDTDLASFGAAQTLQATPFGLRVWKIALYAGASAAAGTVTITQPGTGISLYPPIVVPATPAQGTIILNDNIQQLLTWADFAVTGLTATKTVLMVWYRN